MVYYSELRPNKNTTIVRILKQNTQLCPAKSRKGNRPSFVKAGSPQHAEELYEYLLAKCEQITGQRPQTGQFGALMKVRLTNDGPFTIIMDSEELGY